MGYSPWGRKESDTPERLHFHISLSHNEELIVPKLEPGCLGPKDTDQSNGSMFRHLGITRAMPEYPLPLKSLKSCLGGK